MKIKVLKNTKAAKDKLGIEAFDYQSGETYEIFDELASVFISQNWGVEVKEQIKQEIIIEEKAIENLENKSIKKKGKK